MLKKSHPNRKTLPGSSFGVFSFSSNKYNNSHAKIIKIIESYLFQFWPKFGQKKLPNEIVFQVLIAELYFSLSYLVHCTDCICL